MAGDPVLLFDGVCNFCNATVNFVIDHEPSSQVKFAPLQSPVGQELLKRFGLPTDQFNTMVVVDQDRAYLNSDAAMHVARRLSWPWRLFAILAIVPRPIRDAVYRVIVKNRFRLMGQADSCRVPTPELRERFLA